VRTGDVRPRRALRLLLRSMLLIRGVGRAQRQPRPVRPGLPPALRPARGWRTDAAGRCTLPALARRPLRAAPDAGDRAAGRVRAQDRGALQGCRLCGVDHGRLPPGSGRSMGRAPISSPARTTRRWCAGGRRATAACSWARWRG
jgi:hypothetical protein